MILALFNAEPLDSAALAQGIWEIQLLFLYWIIVPLLFSFNLALQMLVDYLSQRQIQKTYEFTFENCMNLLLSLLSLLHIAFILLLQFMAPATIQKVFQVFTVPLVLLLFWKLFESVFLTKFLGGFIGSIILILKPVFYFMFVLILQLLMFTFIAFFAFYYISENYFSSMITSWQMVMQMIFS